MTVEFIRLGLPPNFTSTFMARRHFPPRRWQAGPLVSTLAALFITLFAVFCACPLSTRAQYNVEGYGYDTDLYGDGDVIGINLGNTYSRVSVHHEYRVHVLANEHGSRSIPSWVAFDDEKVLVGDAAKDAFQSNLENTVFDVGQLLGRTMDDEGFQQDMKHWPFMIKEKDGNPVINVQYRHESREFTPEEILGMIMTKLKDMAEAYLGQSVTKAVVTVPVYFNATQHQAVKNAGVHAGLDILRIISEPMAAVKSYGIHHRGDEQRVLTYDLGGSTLDITVLTMEDGYLFEPPVITGDRHLGGADFDERVVDYLVKIYRGKTGKDVSSDLDALGRLRQEVEKAKWTLSSHESTTITIEAFENGHSFSESLTRAKFEELNMDLFLETLHIVSRALVEANIKREEVDEIVLVGGSAHIPMVRELLKGYFGGKEPIGGIDPDEAVVHAIAIQDNIFSIDERLGCFLTINDYPLWFGVETIGGALARFTRRDAIERHRTRQNFSTGMDDQSSVLIRVFEGLRPMAKDSRFLVEFNLHNISLAPSGVPQIQITFEYNGDRNGGTVITAASEGSFQSITIHAEDDRLPMEDVDHMSKEARQFAEEDWKRWGQSGPHRLLPPSPRSPEPQSSELPGR